MENLIGQEIYENRLKTNLTQDEFGAKYGVSGPAVFKFEKGYVKPSFDLWLKMAKEFGIEEKKSVLMWAKSRLPDSFQDLIDVNAPIVKETAPPYKKEKPGIDYSKFADKKEMRKALLKDEALPKGLKDFVMDEELWMIFKPTGPEINYLINTFGKLSDGTKSGFREVLRLLREFKNIE